MARLVAVLGTLATPFMLSAPAAAAPASSADTGLIKGVVRDKETGRAVAEANVILECNCMEGVRTTTTNGNGLYRFKGLPAGIYTMQAVNGDTIDNKSVELGRGQTQTVSFSVAEGGIKRDIIIKKKPVRIDPASGIVLDAAEMDKAAMGGADRDAMDAAISATATAGSDPNGPTTGGATSAEMNYVVDGLRTNGVGNNLSTLSTVTEFIGQVEVLEGGYGAEYGQVSGGQVRARRVAGTKKLRGVARFTFTPRLAEPRTIVETDDAIRAVETPDWGMQGVIRASGPFVGEDPKTKAGKAVQDRLFWVAGIVAGGSRATLAQTYHHRIDKNGSGGYDQCPYENGAGDCAEGKDFIATRKFGGQDFPTRTVSAQALFGLDFFINRRHRLGATVRVQPRFQRRAYRRPLASIDPDSLGANPNATLGGAATVANGIVNNHLGWDRGNALGTSVEYQGRVNNDNIEIDASVGFLQTNYEEAWRLDDPSLKDIPGTQINDGRGKDLFQLLDDEFRVGDVSGVTEACNDADLPGLTCPVRSWVSGGLGQYSKQTERRMQGDLSLTHFFNAAGAHQLKYGSQFEHLARKRTLTYSGSNASDFYDNCPAGQTGGGEWCYDPVEDAYGTPSVGRVDNHRMIFIGGNDPNNRGTRGFGRVQRERGQLRAIADNLGNGARVDAHRSRVSTQNYAAFLQDRWAVADGLFLDAGVRWEMQDMRDVLGRPALRIWDSFAPRAGIVYDWTGEGRSRLFANYGWFYQQMPLALINRVYGGLVDVGRTYDHGVCRGNNDPAGNALEVNGQPTEFCQDFGEFTTGLLEGATVPRLRGQYDQAFQVGYQHEIIEDLTVEVRWLHRDLGRAVEDVSTDGGNNFIVANPGEPVSPNAIAAQEARCADLERQLDAFATDDDGRFPVARELQRCEFLADAYSKVDSLFSKPTRNYDAFSFQVVKRFAKNWMVVGSYTYARLIGNYGGFVDPNTGAINIGSANQYDLPELVRNTFGPLPFDVRHRLNVNGVYTFDLKEAGALSLGGGVVAQSGTPISVRAGHNRYRGAFPVYVVPRGMAGRLQPNYQVNTNIEYMYPIGDTMALGAAVRLFNITNAKATLRVDEIYTVQNTRPIAGGDLSDLKHAKIQDPGRPTEHFQRDIVQPQGNYLVETAFQLPLTAQFDLRLMF